MLGRKNGPMERKSTAKMEQECTNSARGSQTLKRCGKPQGAAILTQTLKRCRGATILTDSASGQEPVPFQNQKLRHLPP